MRERGAKQDEAPGRAKRLIECAGHRVTHKRDARARPWAPRDVRLPFLPLARNQSPTFRRSKRSEPTAIFSSIELSSTEVLTHLACTRHQSRDVLCSRSRVRGVHHYFLHFPSYLRGSNSTTFHWPSYCLFVGSRGTSSVLSIISPSGQFQALSPFLDRGVHR